MKRIIITMFMLLSFKTILFSQIKDSLIFEEYGYGAKIYKIVNKEKYFIKDESGAKIFKNLKFCEPISGTKGVIQVIDKKNNMFFIDRDFHKVQNVNRGFSVCGTVGHFLINVTKLKDSLIIHETTFTGNSVNKIKELSRVSKKDVDSIFFINGKGEYSYTENTFIGNDIAASPNTILYIKNGKYGIIGDANKLMYDSLFIHDGIIRVVKDGLQGYYDKTKLKYKLIEPFNFHLAKFELPNGVNGFVDSKGNEYIKKCY